jgi:hypothetical protein
MRRKTIFLYGPIGPGAIGNSKIGKTKMEHVSRNASPNSNSQNLLPAFGRLKGKVNQFFCNQCWYATFVVLAALSQSGLHAQSPSSIGGRTIELTISSGSFPFAGSGKFRFLPSAVDSSYAIVPIAGNVNAGAGSHTYAKTGPSTARLSLIDDEVGGLTANINFNTASSGTYTLSSSAFPGGSQTGNFILYAGNSPASIEGTIISVIITSGEFPFADFGSYRFLPAATGGIYNVLALSGGVVNSSGTYSYSKNSEHTGIISFSDSIAGQGLTSQLSFDTATTGTVFLRKLGSTAYQTGVFSMSAPSVAPSITAHPESQIVNVGAHVTFVASAAGTAPLAYQWRKNGLNLSGASSSIYLCNFERTII